MSESLDQTTNQRPDATYFWPCRSDDYLGPSKCFYQTGDIREILPVPEASKI